MKERRKNQDPNIINEPTDGEYFKTLNELHEMMKEVKEDPKYKEQKDKEPSSIKYYWQRELSQKEINTARDLYITLKAYAINQLEYAEKSLEELDKLQMEIDAKSKNVTLTKYS